MANTIKEKELRTDWPFTSGLTAGTTSQTGHQENLIPEEKSFISSEKRKGID